MFSKLAHGNSIKSLLTVQPPSTFIESIKQKNSLNDHNPLITQCPITKKRQIPTHVQSVSTSEGQNTSQSFVPISNTAISMAAHGRRSFLHVLRKSLHHIYGFFFVFCLSALNRLKSLIGGGNHNRTPERPPPT